MILLILETGVGAVRSLKMVILGIRRPESRGPLSPSPLAGARVESLPGLPLPRGQDLGLRGQRGQREAIPTRTQGQATGASSQVHLTEKIKQFIVSVVGVFYQRLAYFN